MFVVCWYIDDLIYFENDIVMINDFKNSIMTEIDMIDDLGLMHYFFSFKVL